MGFDILLYTNKYAAEKMFEFLIFGPLQAMTKRDNVPWSFQFRLQFVTIIRQSLHMRAEAWGGTPGSPSGFSAAGGDRSNRWAQTALRPPRAPPTRKCIQTLSLYRPHTPRSDVHTKDSCPYLPTFKPGLITSQSSVTQWALDNKRSGPGDHNFTELS